ncbi:MAG: hypoxanthine-guanine phosphoribosyltransferase [Gammaproteobacteria bacterium]|nr:hypoxanthine-guanine phosphoribosyltransferase [Gammaproteobacteria bacterium]
MQDDANERYAPPGEMVHTAEAVQAAIARQASELRPMLKNDYPLVLVLMQGAIYYAAWLTLALEIPLELDYAHVSRYADRRHGRELVWQRPPAADLEGRSVLIVDDIYDEGLTLDAVRAACRQAGAGRLSAAVLARKRHDRARGAPPDSVALEVPDRFIVGCGLDDAGRWRNLSALYALDD